MLGKHGGHFFERGPGFLLDVGLVEVEEDVRRHLDADLRLGFLDVQVLHLAAQILHLEHEIEDLVLSLLLLRPEPRPEKASQKKARTEPKSSRHDFLPPRHWLIGTSSIGPKCGITIEIFLTSSGGAGNFAQRLPRDFWSIS